MKTAMKKLFLFLLLMILFFSSHIKADGEIEIDSWTELASIGIDINYPCGAASYILTRNLTSSDADYATVAGPGANFQPICNTGDDFSNSTFDGQNHEIQDLVIDVDSGAALFNDLEGATIKNLFLVDVSITGDVGNIGSVARRTSAGTIENVHVTGTITNGEGRSCTGGIIGNVEESTTIFRSSADVNVTGSTSVGGLVGCSNEAGDNSEGVTISQSYSMGNITATAEFFGNAGGLLGLGRGSTIVDSYSQAEINSAGYIAGGLAGALYTADYDLELFTDSFVYNSYATGSVTAYDYVGGLIGEFSGSHTEEEVMYDSFATGQVSATSVEASVLGGLIGNLANNASSSIWNSYWHNGYDYPDGFACYVYGEGALGNDGCTALTDLTEFQDDEVLSEIAADWDFEGEDAIWKTVVSDHPILFWQAAGEEESDPAPTPTPTTTSSHSSSHASAKAPSCSSLTPVSISNLFQINTTFNSAKLFFTPLLETSEFYISFSENADAEQHGAQVPLAREGVQNFTVNLLKPNATYYFKVRGQNGCATGEWSNIMQVRTDSRIYYKNFSPSNFTSSLKQTNLIAKNTESINNLKLETESTPIPTPTQSVEQSSPADTQATKNKCFLWWCW